MDELRKIGQKSVWLLIFGLIIQVCLTIALSVAGVSADNSEDALITYRVAVNWVRFGEPVFNPGERVETYTNPLWMALMALSFWIGTHHTLQGRFCLVRYCS